MQPGGWPAYLAGFALAALLLIFPVAGGAAAPAAKPTIYEFGRRLCPICRATEAVLKDVEARYPGQITLRFLYIPEEEAVFREYGVTFVPTQIFLDAAGREVQRHEGPLTREELLEKLRTLKFIRE
jgi:thioredoxin-like negative regulator of GroEL